MQIFLCLSYISILQVTLVAHARPENLFLSDSSALDINADLKDDSQWRVSTLPDPAINSPALDTTTSNDDKDLFTNSLDPLLTSGPEDPFLLSSACNTRSGLTDDSLQARGEGSCSPPKPQADLKLPNNIYDTDFLPQGIGSAESARSEAAGGREDDIGLTLPEAFRLKQDPQLCPTEIFLASTTPVCNNPITGSIEIDASNLYRYMLNLLPYTPVCPLDNIYCCSIIITRHAFTQDQLDTLARLNPDIAYDGYYGVPFEIKTRWGIPVPGPI